MRRTACIATFSHYLAASERSEFGQPFILTDP
jgi:hypothetical protein